MRYLLLLAILLTHYSVSYFVAQDNETPEQILFSRRYLDNDSEIFVVNLDGSGLEQLTDNAVDDDMPVWSPDGSHIAFTSDSDIWIMDADGFNLHQLTSLDTSESYPQWSPDGEKILFTSNRSGNLDIYVMLADGSDLTQLTHDETDDYSASWSPDGTQIVFTSEREGNPELYLMTIKNSSLRRITYSEEYEYMPIWVTTREITFLVNGNSIRVVNLITGEIKNVVDVKFGLATFDLITIEDNLHLIFSGNPVDMIGSNGLWWLDIETGDAIEIQNTTAGDEFPAWKPLINISGTS